MAMGLLGKKVGMTQVFDKKGNLIPVTLIEAGPCFVLQKKDKDSDGYTAIQIGFEQIPRRKVTKPLLGHFKKAETEPQRIVREIRVNEEDLEQFEIGQVINVDLFKEGEKVDITGYTKGHGFTGAVKRFHISRGPMSHGSRYHRRPGSMGASSDPSHTFKGKVNPGRMGNSRRTIQNLKIISTDQERNLLIIKGSVPGSLNSFVLIRKSVKNTNR